MALSHSLWSNSLCPFTSAVLHRPYINQRALRRRWIEADRPPSPSNPPDTFVAMSYNVLGDRNALKHRHLYPNVPPEYMRWERRRRLICDEVWDCDADVVCMQGRTGESKDGCAAFWKENMFRLVDKEDIEFKLFGLRDNVAQIFVLEFVYEMLSNGGLLAGCMSLTCVYNELDFPDYKQACEVDTRRIVFGNVHVLFNPNSGDIKLGQIRILLSKVHALSDKWGGIPVVLAGDFNSTPESAIYAYLATAELNVTGYDRRDLSGQNRSHPSLYSAIYSIFVFANMSEPLHPSSWSHCWTDEELINATGLPDCRKLEHPLNLNSSYAIVKGNTRTRGLHGEPLATTYHSKFLGTVDYLWYSNGVAPTRVLDTLALDTLRKTGGLPSKTFGSDHLPLATEFTFQENIEEQGCP
ncbi:hypothetical protein QJS04_geneDACA011898 [Acorus gramineus]|uniref:Endonuclease/exonuclease/phosphatase domain-containing protein n=1 Tax=Acorus gramineus TaxID=55184 RepID=A0AAV9AIU3_ACOGR|nr:hypothetical protein QJS04_geneDACA011898 [Acorus gramineus]